jgi:mono/diheme cytochrome c family protein
MKDGMRTLTILMLAAFGTVSSIAQSPPARFGLGQPAPADLIAAWDIAVMPDGKGLPPGKGTSAEGAAIYAAQCAMCHGAKGEGGTADTLVGPEPKAFAPFGPQYEKSRRDARDVPFTIGNYWPYATTIFDYIRRAMPPNAAGSLKADPLNFTKPSENKSLRPPKAQAGTMPSATRSIQIRTSMAEFGTPSTEI